MEGRCSAAGNAFHKRDGATTVERYRLRDDGTMELMIERLGREVETLLFRRQ